MRRLAGRRCATSSLLHITVTTSATRAKKILGQELFGYVTWLQHLFSGPSHSEHKRRILVQLRLLLVRWAREQVL